METETKLASIGTSSVKHSTGISTSKTEDAGDAINAESLWTLKLKTALKTLDPNKRLQLKSFVPHRCMAVHPNDSTTKYETLLEIVLKANLRRTSQCETISVQLKLLLEHLPQEKHEFMAFGPEETDRVDAFFYKKLDDKSDLSAK
ncbi:hypothetical protein LSH36_1493g00064 [Paralvinella palmiformis]|uniref:Uncharacterized protein n=1 Tax=Paralvinella palmiformis TaxID=53620 RepID=A0AAD9IT39_9ANNE|nr:hypothetical protein LSH36_1493g00064 [Paralvinella palmiformis]